LGARQHSCRARESESSSQNPFFSHNHPIHPITPKFASQDMRKSLRINSTPEFWLLEFWGRGNEVDAHLWAAQRKE
jgi:hypothetical protein